MSPSGSSTTPDRRLLDRHLMHKHPFMEDSVPGDSATWDLPPLERYLATRAATAYAAGVDEQAFVQDLCSLVAAQPPGTPWLTEDGARIGRAVGMLYDAGLWPWA